MLNAFTFCVPPEPEINEDMVTQLMSMGFHREGCRKAVFHTKNISTEAAMNWILEHMDDAGINDLKDYIVTDKELKGGHCLKS